MLYFSFKFSHKKRDTVDLTFQMVKILQYIVTFCQSGFGLRNNITYLFLLVFLPSYYPTFLICFRRSVGCDKTLCSYSNNQGFKIKLMSFLLLSLEGA